MKNINLLFIISLYLLFSCSEEGNLIKPSLDDLSGNYKILYVNPSMECPRNGINVSNNDLVINSNGNFERKIYLFSTNDECVVSEVLLGSISETDNPYVWEIEYNNSGSIESLLVKDRKRPFLEIIFDNNSNQNAIQYVYLKTN